MNYKDLIGKKMKVTPSQSGKVQEWIFENGGTWTDGDTTVSLPSSYLLFNKEGISECGTVEYFDHSSFKEISYTVFEARDEKIKNLDIKLLQAIGGLGMYLGEKKNKDSFNYESAKQIALSVLMFLENNKVDDIAGLIKKIEDADRL